MEAEMLQQKILLSNWLKVVFLLAVVAGVPHAASALPKQGSGGTCNCVCVAPSGIGGQIMTIAIYNSLNYQCPVFNGKTCNVSNPNTGGVATGSLIGCDKSTVFTQPVIVTSPFSGIQVFTGRRLRAP
jgi:hypothetical protein